MDTGYIYYTNSNNALCKYSIDSGKNTEIYGTRKVYHLNVKGKYAYFYSYTDNNDVALFRINLNESDKGAQPIKVLNNTMPCLNIVGDMLYYTDRDDSGGFAIKLLNTSDVEKTPVELYSYEYESDEEDEKDELETLIAEEKELQGDEEDSTSGSTSEIADEEDIEEEAAEASKNENTSKDETSNETSNTSESSNTNAG
jgi:hypothetical protein